MHPGSEAQETQQAAPRWPRELLQQGVLLLAMLALFFPGVFLRGELASGADLLFKSPPWEAHAPAERRAGNEVMPDIVTAMVPYYALTEQALEQGQWPLWNPLEMAGMPLLANCQSAVFYPPRLLHAFLDLHTATSCYYLLKLWLCGMTAFACARGLGLGQFGACFFSLAWAFNGFNFVWCYWPLPDVSAWLPVLFYGVEMAARGDLRRGTFGVASGGALMLLAGHPESAFTQALGAGVYLALRLLAGMTPPRVLTRAVFACGAGWLLALGLTAAQWMPFLEYLVNSYTLHERSGQDFGNYIPMIGVMTFFVPRFLGTNADGNFWGDNTFNLHAYYPGLITWAGLFLAVALLRDRTRRPMVLALLIAALLCALWSFGTPGVPNLFMLPGLHALRLNYNIAFAVFAACLLGAVGLEAWLAQAPRRGMALTLVVGTVASLALIYLAYDFIAPLAASLKVLDHAHRTLREAGVIALLTVMAVLLVVPLALLKRPRTAAVTLLAMLVLDLYVALHGMNPTLPRGQIFPDTPLIARLRELPAPARVQVGAGYVASGLLVPYGIEDWLGYDGLYPDRVLRFNKELGPDIWHAAEPLCSIPWYLQNPEIAAMASDPMAYRTTKTFPAEDTQYFERVAEEDGLELYRNKKALPRAYVVGAVRALPDREAVFEALRSPEFRPGTEVLSEAVPPGTLPATPGPAGTAEVVEHTPNRVRIRVQAERAGALVLSDAYYPGWRATLNGAATRIFPAYYAFRAVLVPAGASEVEFTYFPRSFQLGLAISVATAICSLFLTWALRWCRP